ncbi:hypothetical protein [Cupriavidus pauculus]|jgi:hypothetical protein|uniref:hypothetical protein n=1 Tax=Cupriavidus pauculus TaxID=82633 RepID=UPI003857E502
MKLVLLLPDAYWALMPRRNHPGEFGLVICAHGREGVVEMGGQLLNAAQVAAQVVALPDERHITAVHLVACSTARPALRSSLGMPSDAYTSSFAAQLSTRLPGRLVFGYVNSPSIRSMAEPATMFRFAEEFGREVALRLASVCLAELTQSRHRIHLVIFQDGRALRQRFPIAGIEGKTYAVL